MCYNNELPVATELKIMLLALHTAQDDNDDLFETDATDRTDIATNRWMKLRTAALRRCCREQKPLLLLYRKRTHRRYDMRMNLPFCLCLLNRTIRTIHRRIRHTFKRRTITDWTNIRWRTWWNCRKLFHKHSLHSTERQNIDDLQWKKATLQQFRQLWETSWWLFIQ